MPKEDHIRFIVELKPDVTVSLDADLGERGWAVLASYGRAMLSAQLLEFTMFQLAHQDRKAPKGWERALAQIEGLLKQPKGDQMTGLKDVDPDLMDELRLAVEVRNKLAHDGLIQYRVDAAVRGESAHAEALAMYRAIALFLDSVPEQLDEIADGRLADQGLADLDDEEMDAILQSLRRWADQATFSDEDE